MELEAVCYNDFDEIKSFQPDGWDDIVPKFKYYVDSQFCFPVKAVENRKIVGIGASILLDGTAWLAHIIVSPEHRNKGIGYKIVEMLLNHHDRTKISTILLIATQLGFPVYEKIGFRTVTEYLFFKRDFPWKNEPASRNIIKLEKRSFQEIYTLEKKVTGEDRSPLFGPHLENTLVYLQHGEVAGFYIPDLCEGPIIAETDEAGLALMQFKYAKTDKAVIPSDNISGIDFLLQNGFALSSTKGTRMVMGKELQWFPKKIFSRISGNFG
jgi:GNAT superfamily N-acetyltransferase